MNRHLLALGTGAILLAVPGTASGAVSLGVSPDAALPGVAAFPCVVPSAPACTLATDRLANEPLRIPSFGTTTHGVVTKWRVHGRNGNARLRRLDGGLDTGLGASAWGALPATMGTVEHDTELPVQAGDAIGVDVTAGGEIAWAQLPGGADTVVGWAPALPDGVATPPTAGDDGWIYLEAIVEPDANQDGRGDESHPPPDPPPPICQCGPPPPEPRDPPRVDPPRTDPPRTDVPRPDPYASLPKAGPRVSIARSASASRKGVASVTLTNPYGVTLTGTVKARRGRKALGSTKMTLAASGSRVVKVKLDRAGKRTLARKGKLKVTLAATLRAPVGRARTTSATVTVRRGAKPAPPRQAPRSGGGTGAGGFDGTYRASDGLVMAVEGGVVKSFSGSITTYCTKAGTQKLVSYGMFGDDPDPRVGADGRFAYEATRGYGFVKLKYEGRIVGDRASGKLVVEDRSPLLGTGRIEFDYCFAGKDWSASK